MYELSSLSIAPSSSSTSISIMGLGISSVFADIKCTNSFKFSCVTADIKNTSLEISLNSLKYLSFISSETESILFKAITWYVFASSLEYFFNSSLIRL